MFQAALSQRPGDGSSDGVTAAEREQLSSAWSNPEFKALFMDYVREIQDPAVRAENEAFLRSAAADPSLAASVGGLPPGMALVTPAPEFGLAATSTAGKRVWINICSSARVPAPSGDASLVKLPHLMGAPHMEAQGAYAYDVCFHPDAFKSAYSAVLVDTAVEAVAARVDGGIDTSSVKRLPKVIGVPGVMSAKSASLTPGSEPVAKRPPAPVSEPHLPVQHKTVVQTAPRYNDKGQVVLQPRVEMVERFKSGLTASSVPIQIVFKVHLPLVTSLAHVVAETAAHSVSVSTSIPVSTTVAELKRLYPSIALGPTLASAAAVSCVYESVTTTRHDLNHMSDKCTAVWDAPARTLVLTLPVVPPPVVPVAVTPPAVTEEAETGEVTQAPAPTPPAATPAETTVASHDRWVKARPPPAVEVPVVASSAAPPFRSVCEPTRAVLRIDVPHALPHSVSMTLSSTGEDLHVALQSYTPPAAALAWHLRAAAGLKFTEAAKSEGQLYAYTLKLKLYTRVAASEVSVNAMPECVEVSVSTRTKWPAFTHAEAAAAAASASVATVAAAAPAPAAASASTSKHAGSSSVSPALPSQPAAGRAPAPSPAPIVVEEQEEEEEVLEMDARGGFDLTKVPAKRAPKVRAAAPSPAIKAAAASPFTVHPAPIAPAPSPAPVAAPAASASPVSTTTTATPSSTVNVAAVSSPGPAAGVSTSAPSSGSKPNARGAVNDAVRAMAMAMD